MMGVSRRRLFRVVSAVGGLSLGLQSLLLSGAARAQGEQEVPDWDVPGGHFFTQTVPAGTPPDSGYALLDGGGVQFWRDFVRLGGPAQLGYPVTTRFETDESFFQVTQAALLRWNASAAEAEIVPVFQALRELDLDGWLEAQAIPPTAQALVEDPWLPADTRLDWLTHPVLAGAYSSVGESDRMRRFGLPMGEPQRFGPFLAQRFDRAVMQLWLDNVPGQPSAGSVSLVQVGDLLREAALIPEDAFKPEPAPAPRPVPVTPADARVVTASEIARADLARLTGKHVLLSIRRQWWYAVEDGRLLYDGPVTTGRPELYTPLGSYRILSRHSPYTFISPWPPGSPFWYETATSSYALRITDNGIFLHDAPWRPYNGPGTNVPHVDPDGVWRTGSHGCINMPLAAAAWLYHWAPVGTPVVVGE
jgi:hypothetical protein